MTATVLGPVEWSRETEDPYGHRTYRIKWRVECTSVQDGPQVISTAAGLPVVGAYWNYGNDIDVWAICHPQQSVNMQLTGEPGTLWFVENTFSTKPIIRCQDTPIDNPLNEPPLISGSFVKYTQQAMVDRFGIPLLSSSAEPFTGALVERDYNRATVNIQMNVPSINPLWFFLIDTVNNSPMWGLGPHCVKLSNAPWKRLLWGSCSYYYQIDFQFDIDFNTFDRYIPDAGNRTVARGGDCTKPGDYNCFRGTTGDLIAPVPMDGAGNIAKAIAQTLLDSRTNLGYDADGNPIANPRYGLPYANPHYDASYTGISPYYSSPNLLFPQYQPYIWKKELYDEGNLLLLPVPLSF